MPKKRIWAGYKNLEDYFANAPEDLLQRHFSQIHDFESSLLFTKALRQYRNPTPLLRPSYKVLESMGLGVSKWDM